LRPGTNQPITIDDSDFFVSQQYVDFLSRVPDQGGFDYWTNEITKCAGSVDCILDRRIGVSGAFFVEPEFQQSGSYVYRFFRGALGKTPSYAEFNTDRHQVVGGANLEASKAAYAEAFTQKPEFVAKYGSITTSGGFVDALLATIKATNGVDLSSRRTDLIAAIDSPGGTRGKAVRLAIDDSAFTSAEYNNSFVLMEYFGYLRRDPDSEGYNFWVNVLNNKEPNNYRGMICSFITSAEYQLRFGQAVTHTNQECRRIH
jgi:hypothetical protein